MRHHPLPAFDPHLTDKQCRRRRQVLYQFRHQDAMMRYLLSRSRDQLVQDLGGVIERTEGAVCELLAVVLTDYGTLAEETAELADNAAERLWNTSNYLEHRWLPPGEYADGAEGGRLTFLQDEDHVAAAAGRGAPGVNDIPKVPSLVT